MTVAAQMLDAYPRTSDRRDPAADTVRGSGKSPDERFSVVSESGQAARVQAVLDIPLHRFLGVELLDPAEPAAGISFPVADAAQNQAALLHGGVVTALLDVASYLALLPHLDDGEHAVTHDLSVSLLRPVGADERVDAAGSVLRRGRAVAFLRAEARVDGRTVAAAHVTKSIIPMAADPEAETEAQGSAEGT
jgi:uncharacterized protein (TIGR00369 family)